jgi:hypothetical protein
MSRLFQEGEKLLARHVDFAEREGLDFDFVRGASSKRPSRFAGFPW